MDAYSITLAAHNIIRWIVVLAGLAAVIQGILALATGGSFDKRHKLSNLGFLISMDTNLLLGLLLYAVLSPTMTIVFSDFGAAMKDSVLRFWAVEHITGMLVGIVLMHVSYVFVKRAKTDRGKHIWTAAGMGISLLIVLASIPWPFRAASAPLFPGL